MIAPLPLAVGVLAEVSSMKAIYVTPALRRAIQEHYRLREPVTAREVNDEYRMLVRKGLRGIAGDNHLEALRDVFVRHGLDPVHGV